ncbi:MAG TPA: hypothetical protein VK756_11680 [Solirubrobacteraceae bacterium]|nr:hypothetical protein [Solirubrobacteraceae bacterium]
MTLPQHPAGAGPGGFLGGGARRTPTLPKGMTRAQYEEVLKKCGGGFRGPGLAAGGRHTFDSPRFRQALVAFSACLRQHGVNVPEPNTSGKGPVFNTKGIDTKSPQFRQAEVKCRAVLLASLRAQAGTTGAAKG